MTHPVLEDDSVSLPAHLGHRPGCPVLPALDLKHFSMAARILILPLPVEASADEGTPENAADGNSARRRPRGGHQRLARVRAVEAFERVRCIVYVCVIALRAEDRVIMTALPPDSEEIGLLAAGARDVSVAYARGAAVPDAEVIRLLVTGPVVCPQSTVPIHNDSSDGRAIACSHQRAQMPLAAILIMPAPIRASDYTGPRNKGPNVIRVRHDVDSTWTCAKLHPAVHAAAADDGNLNHAQRGRLQEVDVEEFQQC